MRDTTPVSEISSDDVTDRLPRGFISRSHLRALLPLWLLVLVLGSFLPGEAKRAIGTQSSYDTASHDGDDVRHRLWHVVSFGATAFLVALVNRRLSGQVMWCAAVAGLGYAIELGQSAVFGTPMEWWDVRDNGYGVLAFLLLGQVAAVRQFILREKDD